METLDALCLFDIKQLMLTHKSTVYPWHCDHMGHMNVMYYVNKFDEATWQFFAKFGLTPAFLREQQRGMVAAEQTIRYKKEVLAGDVVEVSSELVEIKSKGFKFRHRMHHSVTQVVVAETDLFGIFIDTTQRKAVALPEGITAQMKAHLPLSLV